VLRWVYWWNSTEEVRGAVTSGEVLIQLNTDFSTQGMNSQELQAVVAAWQCGAISRDTMFELFRKGEILPDGRTNEDEAGLVLADGQSWRTATGREQGTEGTQGTKVGNGTDGTNGARSGSGQREVDNGK
jgi:hypothetical protein